ncbi:MAG: Gfo/Idh/MocA family oxidoreductase, partial [Verrucomicrobia bacterium]|nr:Gfo/Idh/MocA family oxidoreductase [Verrucomicrobiota bacterium]
MASLKAGILGCGKISSAYFEGTSAFKDVIEVVACADQIREAAESQAAAYRIPKVQTADELLQDPEIDIIINLSPPQGHVPMNRAALENGKHVYSEKPFGLNMLQADGLLELASEKGLHITCAPDTVLGGVHQTCRELIEEGLIGVPNSATAFFANPGHEHWHPNPEFYYLTGGGPLFDMGPYYLSALAQMLGPATSLSARTTRAFDKREIFSEPKKGQWMNVEVKTHTTGLIDYKSGPVATTLFSFDCMGKSRLPTLEIYGSEGSLTVPDPNHHTGEIFFRPKYKDDEAVPLRHTYEASRGIGPADMAAAIIAGQNPRASGEIAYHVLEIMESFELASNQRSTLD